MFTYYTQAVYGSVNSEISLAIFSPKIAYCQSLTYLSTSTWKFYFFIFMTSLVLIAYIVTITSCCSSFILDRLTSGKVWPQYYSWSSSAVVLVLPSPRVVSKNSSSRPLSLRDDRSHFLLRRHPVMSGYRQNSLPLTQVTNHILCSANVVHKYIA